MNDALPEGRRRTGSVMAFTWLMILTVLFAVDHVTLMRDIESVEDHASREALAATQNQVGALQSRLETLTDSSPVARAHFDAAQQAVDARLGALEQTLTGTARADALTLLTERVQTLEQQLARVRRSTAAQKLAEIAQPALQKPLLQDPPFSVIGSELRAGERFLSIAPIDAHAIGQIRVMRPGDAEGPWRLDAVDANNATFTVDGVTRRISLH